MVNQQTVRLDKWLWAARFFKTRAIAATAVNGGKVHVNGARTKPARGIAVGNRLTITKGPYVFEIVIRRLADRRGSAKVAQTLYEESPQSVEDRHVLMEQQKINRMQSPRPPQRPGKRDRRFLLREKGRA